MSSYAFGPFELHLDKRMLLENGVAVRLGSRALDILVVLLERAGTMIPRDEMMRIVWPETTVVEANLTVHIAALRRALGDGRAGARYIVNAPGRGYTFAAPVTRRAAVAEPPPAIPRGPAHNLPTQLTRLIGRADVVRTLVDQLDAHRLVTVVGAGGIGKTAAALSAAETLLESHPDGVWMIDLARVADARLVPIAVATVLGLETRSDDPLPVLAAALRERRALLLVDNCEHVIDAAASMVHLLLERAPALKVLATSREPLLVRGERVHRLVPLACPAATELDAAEALRFAAVELFVQRAAAVSNEFELTDADAPSAGQICRELDGIPLAIELAAVHVGTFGVQSLAARLGNGLRLPSGRRGTLPRHRTIAAALDWSHHLLTDEERAVLRRLAVFAGSFSLEAACAVAGEDDLAVADALGALVMKSMVVGLVDGKDVRFRLLVTTRAYALGKLAASGEQSDVERRHAAHYAKVLGAIVTPSVDWPESFANDVDNLRAALAWSFGPGDAALGCALAASSESVWIGLSLFTEYRAWMERAVQELPAAAKDTRLELVLQYALSKSHLWTSGATETALHASERALALALRLGDVDYQARMLLADCLVALRLGDFGQARASGERCEAVAAKAGDPLALPMADWGLGTALYYQGRLRAAKAHLERSVAAPMDAAVRRLAIVHYGMDSRSRSMAVLAPLTWLLGFPDRAAEWARDGIDDAGALGRPLELCQALNWGGVRVALASGDTEMGERYITMFARIAELHSLGPQAIWVPGLRGANRINAGEPEVGWKLIEESLEAMKSSRFNVLHTEFLCAYARGALVLARVDEGLDAIARALERIERHCELWLLPEAWRIEGELRLLRGDEAEADACFGRSLDTAVEHEALSWQLRTMTSRARLVGRTDRAAARAMLAGVYAKLTEGFATADLRAAKTLLDELSEPSSHGDGLP